MIFERLPNEVLEEVLLRLGVSDLIRCRQVCTQWQTMIDQDLFWSKKFGLKSSEFNRRVRPMPMFLYQEILDSQLSFLQNLLKNGDCSGTLFSASGQKFPHWNHVGNFNSTWSKKSLQHVRALPLELRATSACFSVDLTHGPNEMHQKISLCDVGISQRLLSYLQPAVTFHAWVYIFSERTSSMFCMLKALNARDEVLASQRVVIPESESDRDNYWQPVSTELSWPETSGTEKILLMFLGDHVLIAECAIRLQHRDGL